jgi:flagellar biosynthesis protein FlhF
MMTIKKFSAENITEALSQIRREMGKDAVILGTSRRTGKVPNGNRVEIVAAREGGQRARARSLSGTGKRQGERNEIVKMKGLDTEIMLELKQIETRLQSIMKTLQIPEGIGVEQDTGSVHRGLLDAGFDPRFLQEKAGNGGLDSRDSLDTAVRSLVRDLSIRVASERISVFLGPSGSGKTTTVLKIVKGVYLPEGIMPNVIYFGSDDDKDTSWLRSQCGALGVKFVRISEAGTLEGIIENKRRSRILIDTPSISSLNDDDMRFLIETSKRREDMMVRLVIDSTMDPFNICSIASCVPQPSKMGLVLTKLDEATRIGGAVSAAITTGIPVTYVTGGRNAGDGIFVPDADLLCEKIVEGLGGLRAS